MKGPQEAYSIGLNRCPDCGGITLGLLDENDEAFAVVDISDEVVEQLISDLQEMLSEHLVKQ